MARAEKPMLQALNPLGIKEFLVYASILAFFYLNYLWLIPKLYFNRSYFRFFGLQLIGLVFIILLPALFTPVKQSNKPLVLPNVPPAIMPYWQGSSPPPPPPQGNDILTEQVFLFMLMLFFSLILRISYRWRQSEREKLNAELLYLKAQINPHFLFNTLNSIYALAIEQSENTASAVVKLSGMMRYVLSESAHEYVSLTKELTYIQHYIDLQRIRFEDSIQLEFSLKGGSSPLNIAPLLLICFIENAFKHGVNAEENSLISIEIRVNEETLELTVFNRKVGVKLSDDHKSGLGIDNTRKRLQLLYPERHHLSIHETPEDYAVHLTISLT
jgi:sensor histidine kinase YesM